MLEEWEVVTLWELSFKGKPLTVLFWIHRNAEKGGKKDHEILWAWHPIHILYIYVYRKKTRKLNGWRRRHNQFIGSAANLLARSQSAFFQGFSSLELALPTVQSSQVPEGGVHCRAGHTHKMSGKKSSTSIPPKIRIALPHLLTLQALYQPPYSPYGVLSLCLPLGVNKGGRGEKRWRTDCDAWSWIVNGSKVAFYIASTFVGFSSPYSSPPFLLHASRWACFQLQRDRQTKGQVIIPQLERTINVGTRALLNYCP